MMSAPVQGKNENDKNDGCEGNTCNEIYPERPVSDEFKH